MVSVGGGPGCPLSAVAVTDCRALWEAARLRYRWAPPRIVSARPSGPNGPPAPLATPPFVMPHWASGGSPTPRLSLLRLSSQASSEPAGEFPEATARMDSVPQSPARLFISTQLPRIAERSLFLSCPSSSRISSIIIPSSRSPCIQSGSKGVVAAVVFF